VLSSNGVSVTEDLAQDASLLQDFLTECGELLAQLDLDLVAMETSPNDTELLNRVFRAFHTIKGTSGFMGFQSVVALTHEAEDVLNLMRKGERKVSRRAIDVFLSVLDQLRRMFADIRQISRTTTNLANCSEGFGN
jgi:two-component system chemotaxis sensor kinase CheA